MSSKPAGVLPYQTIKEMISQNTIEAETAIKKSQIQPSSLDLRLGSKAWRLQASFLPGAGASSSSASGNSLYSSGIAIFLIKL